MDKKWQMVVMALTGYVSVAWAEPVIYRCMVDGLPYYSDEKCQEKSVQVVQLPGTSAILSVPDKLSVQQLDQRLAIYRIEGKILKHKRRIQFYRKKMTRELQAMTQQAYSKSEKPVNRKRINNTVFQEQAITKRYDLLMTIEQEQISGLHRDLALLKSQAMHK